MADDCPGGGDRVSVIRLPRRLLKLPHRTHSRGRAFYYATLYAEIVQRTSFEDMTCSVAQCLDVVGEWWSLLIVRDAFLGVTRFDDFQARLGISRNILTQRLNHLVDSEILKRVAYSEHPPRSEYRLTAKGRDLWHVITAMRQWGDRWAAPAGPPVETRHTACGHVVRPCRSARTAASLSMPAPSLPSRVQERRRAGSSAPDWQAQQPGSHAWGKCRNFTVLPQAVPS